MLGRYDVEVSRWRFDAKMIEEFFWAIAQRGTLPNLTRARMMDAHVQAKEGVLDLVPCPSGFVLAQPD